MKRAIIKVIKRNAVDGVDQVISPEQQSPPESTVTATVTDWIALNRSNRLDEDRASRETIAAWTAEANI